MVIKMPRCPECGAPMHYGKLDETKLVCKCNHMEDAKHNIWQNNNGGAYL